MTDSSDSEEESLQLDDLEGLQRELDALRAELGDGYISTSILGDGQELSDAEDEPLPPPPPLPLPPLPRVAPAATVRLPAPALHAPASRPVPAKPPVEDAPAASSSGEGSEEEDEEDEEQRQRREAAEELRNAAMQVTAALQPTSLARPGTRLRNQQLLEAAPPPPPPPAKKQKKKPAGQNGRNAPASAVAAAAAGANRGAQRGKVGAGPKENKRRGKGKAAAAAADVVQEQGAAEPAAEAAAPVSKLQAIRDALEANRQLQGRLRRLLASTERAVDQNAKVLLRVRALKARKSVAPAVATVAGSIEAAPLQTPIGTSSFWGCAGAGEPLPPNPDAAALQPLYKHLPFSFRGSRWSDEEQQRLRDGVLQLVQELQLQDVMQEMQQRLESGGSVGMADYESSRERIAALTLQSPVVDQLAAGFREVEWATLVQRSRLHRTTTECRLQWTNSLAPSLTQGAWTAEEDEQLGLLAEQHKARQWEAVSRELAAATGAGPRPALACMQRYQQLAVTAGKEARQFGTEEGVARLAGLVASHGSSWKRIAEEFGGGWDPDQLMHIWRRHAQRGPVARKGRWSQEEDDMLLRAMALHGRKWSEVARLVPGRTDVQCRERFMNVLNPDVATFQPWSEADDQLLLQLVPTHTQADGKVKWAAVAAQLPGRTDKQCAIRSRALAAGDSAPKQRKPHGGRGRGRGRGRGKRKTTNSPQPAAGSEEEGGKGSEAGGKEKEQAEKQEEENSDAGGVQSRRAKLPRRARRLPVWLAACGDLGDEEEKEEQEQQEQGGQQQQQQPMVVDVPQQQEQQQQQEQHQQQQQPQDVQQLQEQQQAIIEPARRRGQARQTRGQLGAQPQAGTAVDASAEPPAEQDAGRVGASVLAGPPPATTLVLPLSPEAAVGQHVSVWCIADEATGAGSMCPGTLLSWHPRKRQHSVQYEGKRQRQYCRLQEQTVEWRQLQGSPVTGPGSCWPGPEQDVAEKPPPPPPPQQQSQQPEPGESELQPSAQQGRRSVRLRRSTAKGAADDDEYG